MVVEAKVNLDLLYTKVLLWSICEIGRFCEIRRESVNWAVVGPEAF